MNGYTPQAGTIPARVVDFLATLPPGGEVQTGVLCDAIEQPSASIISSCDTAITFGWIARVKREGRLYWSRGPKAPKVALLDVKPYTPPAPRERVPAPTNSPPAAFQNGTADTPAPGKREAAPQVHETPAAAPAKVKARPRATAAHPSPPACHSGTPEPALTPPAPMRCAVWSDGTLAIEKGGRTETYTPEETRAIVRYLERVLVGEGTDP